MGVCIEEDQGKLVQYGVGCKASRLTFFDMLGTVPCPATHTNLSSVLVVTTPVRPAAAH